MRPTLAFLLAASLPAVLALPARAADPLKSPECGAAVARLEAARQARQPHTEALRREAASLCFGAAATSRQAAPAQRSPAPPVRVPPVALEASRPIPVPRVSPAPPPLAVERPQAINSCDAGGCWTTDGTRLNRVGPDLAGPRGLCGQAAGAVVCP